MVKREEIRGILICVVLGLVAKSLTHISVFKLIGSTSLAIILGAIVGNLYSDPKLDKGIKVAEKKLLEIAIGFMGITLHFSNVLALGLKGVIFIVLVMLFTIFVGIKLGGLLGFSRQFSMMVASGNAVCGSSAIAATAPIIKGKKEEIGVSIAVVNLMGTIFMFFIPFVLLKLMPLSMVESGAIIGASLQSVGQVVASGGMVDPEVQSLATLFKMIRVVLLGGVIILYSWMMNRSDGVEGKKEGKTKFKLPLFIVVFFILCGLNSSGILPESIIGIIKWISKNFLIVAMVGIGMRIKVSSLLEEGIKTLVYGVALTLLQISFGLMLVKVMF